MSEVSLALLGQPRVGRVGVSSVPVAPSLQPFLAFLSLEPDMDCDRERLIDALWPDVSGERGRRRLNTVVWRSRRLLGDGNRVIVSRCSDHVGFDPAAIDIDVRAAVLALSDHRQAAAAAGDALAIEQLREAVLVDVTSFLAGNYDNWVVRARHRLELAVVKGVEVLLQLSTGTPDEIRWAELLVRLDPLREDAHRRLIRLHSAAGRRADALRQYDACVHHLRNDLGVEPLIETTLVAQAIREGVEPLPRDATDPRQALGELRRALAACQHAVDEIDAALSSMKRD